MSNQRYDVLPDLDWEEDYILAYLTVGTAFVGSQTRYSETGALKVGETEITGKVLGEDGEYLGLPAVFNQVSKNRDYQLLLVSAEEPDPALIAFFDSDYFGGPLRVVNSGSLVVRPSAPPTGNPPDKGIWYVPEA